MIAAGNSLGDIAERLHLSPKTISSHKIRLMQKLNIDNNADLIRYATQHMLFEI
jgi:DNA-binding NarL/FixJ family response regulator